MAVEALYQTGMSLGRIAATSKVFNVSYRLRDISFSRAMVLEEEIDRKIFLSLTPCTGPKDSWHEFKISSLMDEVWTEHCRGLIRLLEGEGEGEQKHYDIHQ